VISGFHGEVDEKCALLGYAASNNNSLPTVGDNLSVPSSGFTNPFMALKYCTDRLSQTVGMELSLLAGRQVTWEQLTVLNQSPLIVPYNPIIAGTIFVLTFHILLTSIPRSLYLIHLSVSFVLTLELSGMAISISWQVCSLLLLIFIKEFR
jgi:hypothetical protein